MLAGLTPTGVEESDELYLLSEDGDNVKVRDELIDIKVLREVDSPRPRTVGARPQGQLPARRRGRRGRRSRRFASPSRASPETAYSLSELLDELVEPGGTIRVVSVHKRRVRYTINDCMGELSDIEVDGRHTRTLAIEAEDPAAVWAGVIALGLGDRVNTSVPRGLTALIDDEPPRYAVIDVGTNSVKFHVGEQTSDGAWRAVVDRAEITRLGDGLAASGAISAAARERTTAAIAGMVDEARKHHARAIVAVGTAGLRTASNRDDVVAAIEEATGVTVDPISGEEESRLAYLAVRAELRSTDGALVVFDTGGGSTQFTFGHGAEVDERFSIDVGAVRYTERFGLADAVSTDDAPSRPRRDRVRSPPPGRETGARRPGGHGRCGHEHHGREARPRPATTQTPSRGRSSSVPTSTARSSCTGPATPTAVARSSDSSPSGRT